MEKVLKVKVMGRFCLYYDEKEIILDRNTASKTRHLMQLMMMRVDEGIAKSEIMEVLYGSQEVENKNGSVNNTIFRLRKQLKAAGLPESSYIILRSGKCFWDEAIPVEVDALQFCALIRQAREALSDEEKAGMYRAACELYTGEFLPELIGENWASVYHVSLKKDYFEALEYAYQWHKREKRLPEIYELIRHAVEIYPYDNLQIYQIDSLIAIGKASEAMEVYEHASRMLSDEMGVAPSQEMMELFSDAGELFSYTKSDISDVKERLNEKEVKKGAYFCNYPSFIDIYHAYRNMLRRNGISSYIMVCTLEVVEGAEWIENEETQEAFEKLGKSILCSLRSGDIFTKYNTCQYLILLSEISKEYCENVFDRINTHFLMDANKKYQLSYRVTSLL